MHPGVFEGKKAKDQPVKILILGESHYWGEDKKGEDKRTDKVMEDYLSGKYNYRFFDNIVRAFDIDPENRTDFWERVWFGNYIDEPCGIRDTKATKLLKQPGKREELNKQLFSFINEKQIDVVFCFSRKVYDKLPPLEWDDQEKKGIRIDSHRLDKCIYEAGKRENVSAALSKRVIVYGLKHPSQGFSYRRYSKLLKNLPKEVMENIADA